MLGEKGGGLLIPKFVNKFIRCEWETLYKHRIDLNNKDPTGKILYLKKKVINSAKNCDQTSKNDIFGIKWILSFLWPRVEYACIVMGL